MGRWVRVCVRVWVGFWFFVLWVSVVVFSCFSVSVGVVVWLLRMIVLSDVGLVLSVSVR